MAYSYDNSRNGMPDFQLFVVKKSIQYNLYPSVEIYGVPWLYVSEERCWGYILVRSI